MFQNRTRLITGIVVLLLIAIALFSAPRSFPKGKHIVVPEGASLREVSRLFDEQNVIRFPLLFEILVLGFAPTGGPRAGDYVFGDSPSVLRVAYRVSRGISGIEPVRIRLFEGMTREEMAVALEDQLERFNTARFLELTKNSEGFLFPDTYFFLPGTATEDVVAKLKSTFEERVAELESRIDASGRPLEDVVIMASLIEREVPDTVDRRVVSGILWKRIEIDMPLQVDAPFFYLLGKGSRELTEDDLALDSPYNTYRNRGLPPTPIANPGLDAIVAALEPTETNYLFYLSDSSGTTHFAATFEEHKENKKRYLR